MSTFTFIDQQFLTKDLTDSQKQLFATQMSASQKDRDMALILSVLLGMWGVDRFYVGDMGMGLLKLLTFGGCGIIWLVDIFLIRGKVDEFNRNTAVNIVSTIKSFA